jgi:hypothetical protein
MYVVLLCFLAVVIWASARLLHASPPPDLVVPAATEQEERAVEIVGDTDPEDGLYRGPWKKATATVFWVGEGATDENGFIHNESSAWDVDWREHFGGLDDPSDRCGYHPCAFTPDENPFYIALPYNDLRRGRSKENATLIPWFAGPATSTILKNRWVEVSVDGTSCFGQWEDVGPFETDDVAYVFGDAEWPENEEGVGAGIDLSPAIRDCLSVGDVSEVRWRHVEYDVVPNGPWLSIVTQEE